MQIRLRNIRICKTSITITFGVMVLEVDRLTMILVPHKVKQLFKPILTMLKATYRILQLLFLLLEQVKELHRQLNGQLLLLRLDKVQRQ